MTPFLRAPGWVVILPLLLLLEITMLTFYQANTQSLTFHVITLASQKEFYKIGYIILTHYS